MDSRVDPRYPAEVNAYVTDLAQQCAGEGLITEVSNSGLKVLVHFPVAAGTTLQLDVGTTRLWGHVVHAHQDKQGFTVGLELIEVLVGAEDVTKLLRGLVQYASVESELKRKRRPLASIVH